MGNYFLVPQSINIAVNNIRQALLQQNQRLKQQKKAEILRDGINDNTKDEF